MVAPGGPANIASAEARALTRVRVKVLDPILVNEGALAGSGVGGVMLLDDNVLHLIVGAKAGAVASALRTAADARIVARSGQLAWKRRPLRPGSLLAAGLGVVVASRRTRACLKKRSKPPDRRQQ
jgi:phosphotransferase system IIB component